MKKSEVHYSLQRLKRAIETLDRGVSEAKTELEKDGVIQRFEYTFELLWKTLKIILAYEGIECYSPRSCIKEAFKRGLVEDDELLIEMLEDRNLTSHIYEETKSQEIFAKIKEIYLPYFKRLIVRLEERL